MRVLIFKVNELGDNIVFLPVVQELRRRFPHWELAIFTGPVPAPLYEAAIPDPTRRFLETTARFNGSWRRPMGFARLWRRAAAFRPDACLIADDQANAAYLLAFASGARVRVAIERNFIKVGRLATVRVPADTADTAALANWRIGGALAAAAGETGWPSVPPPPDLEHLLRGETLPPAGCRVVIHAGASHAYQRWFPERFAELAARLAARDGVTVIWIETSDAPTPAPSPAIRFVRTPTLRDLAQTLGGADLYIGNNSGPMHMANALGRPCVILNGPSSYQWDSPWYAERMLMLRDEALSCLPCDGRVRPVNFCQRLSDPMACMKFWTVDAVLERCLDWAQRWREAARPAAPAPAG